jgi:hypothetical protein
VFVALLVGAIAYATRPGPAAAGRGVGTIANRLAADTPPVRNAAAYAGYATWVDGFDYGPAYQTGAAAPPVPPRAVDEMAAAGVKTVFLQAARDDSRSPGGVVDRALVAEFVIRAHRRGMRVVGWYLPTFTDVNADLARLRQIESFDALGHRFDGVAVDIEDVEHVTDVTERNQRLVDLSARLRAESGRDALGAIVLPPVLTEVVNEQYWPEFPWASVRSDYDVWLPMSYWTFRKVSSGYHDGFTYNDESVRRLRNDLGQPNALVHAIGGIGDTATAAELDAFARSLAADGAIGGSVYDWNATPPASRAALTTLFASGPAGHLPRPP